MLSRLPPGIPIIAFLARSCLFGFFLPLLHSIAVVSTVPILYTSSLHHLALTACYGFFQQASYVLFALSHALLDIGSGFFSPLPLSLFAARRLVFPFLSSFRRFCK